MNPSPTPELTVGPATRDDAEAVAALLELIMRQHGLVPRSEGVNRAINDVFDHPEWARFVVARRGGVVVGMLTLVRSYSTWAAAPFATVDDFIVLPGEREQGVGRALMTQAVTMARDAGCARLELNVEEDNERAQAFYRTFGFAQQTRFLYSYAIKS